jgi:regulator of RNase E activity RraA
MSADELAARLSKLDACAVSDALDKLGLRGVVLGIAPVWPCPRIAGRVVTMRLKPKEADEAAAPRHLGTAAIEAASAGDVIVVDHRGRTDVAGWGGILSTAARYKGIAGVIVDGACRDVDESRERGLPVFARAATPSTARGRVVEDSFNEPIAIGGVAVNPGDLVIADGSGVVFVPASRAAEVVAEAETVAAREAQMARDILDGRSVVQVMGTNYETMLERR